MGTKEIILRIQSDYIFVKAPYDQDLINGIKIINSKQREWLPSSGEWKISVIDPDQEPDQMSNLEHLQKICSECSQRHYWKFSDYTSKSQAEVQHEKELSKEEQIEKLLVVLAKLPNGSLKLVRWNSNSLQLQLNQYLGDSEEARELFMQLFRASNEAHKTDLLLSTEQRGSFGFVFTIHYNDRIIRALLDKHTQFLADRRDLKLKEFFEDRVAHFEDHSQQLWIGVEISSSDMGSINWESRNWELSEHDSNLYWVVLAEAYVNAWVREPAFDISYFGGNFGIINHRDPSLKDKVKIFHLEYWFENYLNTLKALPILANSHGRPWIYSASNYSHPLDVFSIFIASEIRLILEEQKKEAARQAIAKDKEDAQSIAIGILQYKYAKDELIKQYGNAYQLKKSWNKQRILEEICSDQQFCEKLIGLPID